MKKSLFACCTGLLLCAAGYAQTSTPFLPAGDSLTISEVRYDGKLSGDEARFTLDVSAIAANKGASSVPLLEGDVAVLPAELPDDLKIVRDGSRYLLVASHAGNYKFKLEVVAKIQREEQWNQISFVGPAATITSVDAQAAGMDTEIQLLNGTLSNVVKTNGACRLTGYLGADQTMALRWQTQVAEAAHKALLTADSTIAAQVTPTVIKYTSKFHYDIVQGQVTELTLALPAVQTLTHLDGGQIRDWHLATEGDRQILTVEFIKPVENDYVLTLATEQTVEDPNAGPVLNPPQPLSVEHESGSLVVSAENTLVNIAPPEGLRQVNAPDNAVAAYEFDERPLALALKLSPIEPEILVADRVNAQLEEARLVVTHTLALNVEKAGIYNLELTPQDGFIVTDVRGDGIEDWNVNNRKVQVDFSDRVLGTKQVIVQLEQSLKKFPDKICVAPLHVTGAVDETAQIGAAAEPGIRLRTDVLSGLREIPVARLPDRSDEILAYSATQPAWNLSIATEHLDARVVADIFNLATIGEGIVGGSAIIRYGLVNQGVQEFKVSVPAGFKNVEFTGPNIRSKEFTNDVWTIELQDKVWDGYTLVVTYDYQFDSAGATLPIGGIHTMKVERETGSIAITTAANLQISADKVSDSLRRIDETELPAADRPFIARAALLAYQYSGNDYDLAVNVKHFAEEPVLEAVADRTQITSVLTDSGQMLTEASFMVKNNEKQFQRFELPANATLWGCYVNGQPAKPQRDGAWVLVPLARDVNRDQTFAVDIMYAQTNGALASAFGKSFDLNAPRTDVPNTYAEWKVYVPPTLRLSNFGGSMNVAEGATYSWLDAWGKFLKFYGDVLREAGDEMTVIGFLAFLVIAFVIAAVRRGWNGVITLFVVMMILAILGGMLLPVLSSAKRRAQRINSVSNLKQIGLAAKIWAGDHNNHLPVSFDEMKDDLGTMQIVNDPQTAQAYTYLGGGMSLDALQPDSVLAYGIGAGGVGNVLFADGSVEEVSPNGFQELSQRGLVQMVQPTGTSANQSAIVTREQMVTQQPIEAPPAPPVSAAGGNYGLNAASTEVPAQPASGPAGFENSFSVMAANGAVGGGGFGGGAFPETSPTVAGVRSIHIELPQTGQPFLFTKVLNIGDEPLSIHARIMRLAMYQTYQMTWQTVLFLIGLLMWWAQWRRRNRNTFLLTVALVMIIGSVCSLLVQWRALHDALIIGFPITTLAIIAFLIWKYWPRHSKASQTTEKVTPETPPAVGGVPPLLASIAVLCVFGLTSVKAADSNDNFSRNGSIVSANYSGTINNRVASVDATLEFSAAQSGVTIPLFGSDVAVQQFIVKSGKAELLRDGSNLAVKLESRRAVTVEIEMLVKVTGDVTKRQLSFAIPPALSSQVSFALDEPGAEVEFPTAISFEHAPGKDGTRVDAVMGAADHVDLFWTPRVKRPEEVAATVFCQNASLVTFGSGVLDVRSTLDYQITQGELQQAHVELPIGQRLLRVGGTGIRTWEVKNENGKQTLVVDLSEGMPSSWRLMVETEKNLEALPASIAIDAPHAAGVKRETGLIALRGSGELSLSVENASGLERVDAQEFPGAGADNAGGLLSVFQFSRPEFNLQAHVETIQPEIEAVAVNNFKIGTEEVLLSASVDYTIKRAGVFTLQMTLPKGYHVEAVNGDSIEQQSVSSGNGSNILEVALKKRTTGDYHLGIELTRDFKQLPKSLEITGVEPLGTARFTSFIALSAEAGVSAKTESCDNLMEIPAVSLPVDSEAARDGSVLAYKYISSGAESNSPPNLLVSTETVAAWVRAEIVDNVSVTETLMSGRALVRYDIANAPVKELNIAVPDNFQNVQITGPNIRSREPDGNTWHLELQSPVQGDYTLTVTWEQPFSSQTHAMEFAGVSAVNVERETGLLDISAKAPMQVTEASTVDLQRVDTGDFPDWAGTPDPATALAYSYVRPGYKLALDVRRLDDAEVLQAIVENAQLTSVIGDDGQMMTEMSLSLQSNGRQFLEIALPPGATVWSAFVAGQPVQPGLRNGKLLLPIEQSAANDSATSVELTYVGTNNFPRAHGQVSFISPQFDVPLKNAQWEVYLPPDYDYKDFRGTMTREIALTPQSASTSFSRLDYSLMEQNNKWQAKDEALNDIQEARRQLDNGNVRGASEHLYFAKTRLSTDDYAGSGASYLEKDLQDKQASNLIAAQSDFSMRNGVESQAIRTPEQAARFGLQYDNSAAADQWAKLQQAQEIMTTKIQPLHVNLPVRGQHFSFTQVLQTESGEAMTIQLFAANTRAVNWPIRVLTGMGAFIFLWAMVAVVSHLTLRARIARQAI
jgi:prepilin-type processing-associated H-X9-DG protein